MTADPGPQEPLPPLLRRLARENQQMGQRLAQLEFREMGKELANPEVFDLKIDFVESAAVPMASLATIVEDPVARRLPPLNVTLGSIAWSDAPDELPVVGIFCPHIDSVSLRAGFVDLMTAHHTQPFARFVFLCENMRPIPFLGRYKLTYEYIGSVKLEQIIHRLSRRFAVSQVVDLISGAAMWRDDHTSARE